MFQSKDGRKSGSAFVAKRRDAESAKKEPMGGMSSQMGKETMGQGMSPAKAPTAQIGASNIEPEEQGGHSAMQVTQEHGPATNVTISHDHKGKKHHVVSRHADGHMHTSDHQSAEDAHAEGAQLSGGGQPEQSGSPDTEGDNAMFGDNFKTPRLA